jgi:alkyldihydroxyacetonephosphate synthase
MKRWNGWGDEATTYPLPDSSAQYLAEAVGEGISVPDASFEHVIASVPDSRLPPHPQILSDPSERVRHARGQSLPDWIAMRSGRIEAFPDGVAHPADDEEVRALFDYARQTGARLIPYGGGTSVLGHINPRPDGTPTLTLAMDRLDHLLELDETSLLATFEAGASGPGIEGVLNPRGYTLGHFPQSWELSTLGGWIATRSCGQQSYHYGRIEKLFAGGRVEMPLGQLDLPVFPASAAGPDLKHLFLGSEGRMGVITRATIRIKRLPEKEAFYAAFFHNWESGVAAVRALTQNDVPVSMLRLSDAQETETTLALAGRERLVAFANRGLRLLRYGPQRCMLIYGLTGDRKTVNLAEHQTASTVRANGGLLVGSTIGKMWRKSRFLTPYLRNTLWERGYALDTVETAVPWSVVLPTIAAIKAAIQDGLIAMDERVLVFAHLSHVYSDGASVYVTFIFRRSADPQETLHRWQILKAAASQTILAHGGTISHQHGVGIDHAPYITVEKGEIGLSLLEAARRSLDPEGIFQPGNLLGDT